VELRQLEYFVAVAGENSFTRAARRLHVVQSAVSAGITALERDLGVLLLERTAQRVRLTEAGAAFLPEAHAVLDSAAVAREVASELSRGVRGSVRVGMLADLGLMDMPGLARDFRDRYPGVELQLRDTGGSAHMLSALSGYEIDVAFAGSAGPLPRDYCASELLRIPQVLALPERHRLAGRPDVGIAELAGEPFIDLPAGSAMRTIADDVFAAHGQQRTIAAQVAGIDAIAAFATAGVGVAILPPYAIARYPRLRAVRIREHDFRWSLNAVVLRRRKLTAATAALLEIADSHLTHQPGVQRMSGGGCL
jgi:DNA-binding transcriptional LysR family regulator